MDHLVDQVLISTDEIDARVKELAARIQEEYTGGELLIVAVLRGSLVFLADLIRSLRMPLRIDVIRASSYGSGTTSSGNVRVDGHLESDVTDKDVLLLDDILDTGRTLTKLSSYLTRLGPRSLKTCVLLDKPSRREVDIEADYWGFRIDDHFVVGYGLDYDGQLRNLPYIGILRQDPETEAP